MTLAHLAEDGLDKYGEYVALAFEGRQYTNLDQQRAASRLAHALRRLGVGPGDRVVVMLPNCPEVIQSYTVKCPKQIRFVDSLPKSPIGKILRKELRTQV